MRTVQMICCLLVVLMIGCCLSFNFLCYPKTAFIIDIDSIHDLVTIEDSSGFLWDFTGVEDYEINDVVSIIMFNNFSKSIFDDEIVSIKFSGFQKDVDF